MEIFKWIIKTISTPKELLRCGAIAFGVLGFLQWAGRADVVSAKPTESPLQTLLAALACLVLLEVYNLIQRRFHLEEQGDVAETVYKNGGTHPPAPPEA